MRDPNCLRFITACAGALLTVSCSLPGRAPAPGERWERSTAAGSAAFDRGAYAEAQQHFARALDEAQHSFPPGDHRITISQVNLADTFRAQRHYPPAETLYRQALRSPSSQGGIAGLRAIMVKLVAVQRVSGQFTEAAALYTQVVVMHAQEVGADHPDLVPELITLAELQRSSHRLAEAEAALHRALTILDATPDANASDTARTLALLALVYSEAGRCEEGAPIVRRSLNSQGNGLSDHEIDALLEQWKEQCARRVNRS